MGTAGDKPVRRKRRSDAIYKDDRERARAKRARRAERDRRAREDAELQVREAAGQKVYRLPDGTLFIRNVIIDVDQPYGGPPDGLDIVAEESTGPDFRLTDDLLEPPPAADLEP